MKNKSTSQAIHIIRRIIEMGERVNKEMYLVLLDWEKAFDNVSQKQLFIALGRMGIDIKLISLIKQLYKNPVYKVEIDGYTSNWHKQHTGIRQGCPLSPYLFLIIMTVMFHDIHTDEKLNEELEEDKILGTILHEILYADDTIIYSRKRETVEKLFRKIESEGKRYGLKLNQNKCELLSIQGNGNVKYTDGTPVPKRNEAKYLGCVINSKGDISREVNKRISECYVV